MAILWMDGFDHYGTGSAGVTKMLDGVWAEHNNSTIDTSRSRTGIASLKLIAGYQNTGQGSRRAFPGNTKSVVGVGYAMWMDKLPDYNYSQQLFVISNTSNQARIAISMDTTGRATVHQGPVSGPVLYTAGAPTFIAGAWQFIEARFDVAGAVELRVNGVSIFSLSGLAMANTGNFAQVTVGPRSMIVGGSTYKGENFWIDDLFSWDNSGSYNNDFVGDRRVRAYYPDSDTAVAGMTPFGQAYGYQCIDETVPNDETDYLLSATPTGVPPTPIVSEFGIQPIDIEVAGISAVQTYTRMRKTDAGDCNIQVGMVSGASVANGVDRPITTQWTYWQDVLEFDPATGAPWTKAALDAAKLRIARTL